MASLLSNLVDNLAERIDEIKFKYWNNREKCETREIKYKHCECCLKYTNVKDDLIKHKCFCCNKTSQNMFHENSIC